MSPVPPPSARIGLTTLIVLSICVIVGLVAIVVLLRG